MSSHTSLRRCVRGVQNIGNLLVAKLAGQSIRTEQDPVAVAHGKQRGIRGGLTGAEDVGHLIALGMRLRTSVSLRSASSRNS